MRKRSRVLFPIIFLLSALCVSVAYCMYSNAQKRLNVILIALDSLRPDHLGCYGWCYGYQRNTSPTIDRLAGEGILYTQAVSNATFTWPSINCMMTSRYPLSDKVFFFDEFLPHPKQALPALLKKAGYATAFFSNHIGLSRFNESLGNGFGTFVVKGDGIAADGPTKDAMAWIKTHARKRFFLWLFYFDTHEDFVGFPKTREGILPDDTRKYVRMYDDHIRYVDAQIALLMQHIQNMGIQRRTAVIITSDHGELLGEHADQYTYFKHGDRPWEFLIRVPLVLYCPQALPKGKVVQQQVQHIDIPPTVCDLVGIRAPGAFEGRSLLPAIKKGAPAQYAFIESRSVPAGFLTASETPEYQYAVRTTDWKLMFNRFTDGTAYYKFYHLTSDPLEANDVLMAQQERVAVFKAALDGFLLRQKQNTAGPLRKALTEENVKALKSLGYAQ